MAKRTLLELVQDTLSAIDGDEVNSISDTVESLQIVRLIRQAYFDICDEADLPVHKNLFNLTGQADTNKPTHMLIPQNVSNIEWVKYDVRADVADPKSYKDIPWKEPADFMALCNSRDSTDTDNQVVLYTANLPIIVSTIAAPSCWTTFDDEYVIFDSFDSAVDTTLQTAKTQCYGTLRSTFTETDTFVVDLPENLFGYLSATVEARAFALFKQTLNPKSEQRENRMRIRSQRNKLRSGRGVIDLPDYGRK